MGGAVVVTLLEVLCRPAALYSNKIPALLRLKRIHQSSALPQTCCVPADKKHLGSVFYSILDWLQIVQNYGG